MTKVQSYLNLTLSSQVGHDMILILIFEKSYFFRCELLKQDILDGTGVGSCHNYPSSSWTDHLPLLGGKLSFFNFTLFIDTRLV